MALEFHKAVRKASPMLVAVSGVSGSGKTLTALLLAAGIAGPGGRVGMLDTENGRGVMYADDSLVMAALPNGYEIIQLDNPFSPARYVEVVEAAENAGINVLVIDSATHEWEGLGGCAEIAEKNKLRGMPNWAMAKREHKRFMNHCLSSSMHIIFCLRAREQTKIVKIDGKETFVPQGIQPVAEKNFAFEMLIHFEIDKDSHHAYAAKVPRSLAGLFPNARLLTKDDGVAIQKWNATGKALAVDEQLRKRASAAAEEGMRAYQAFWGGITPNDRKLLADAHAANKKTAERVDAEMAAIASEEDGDRPRYDDFPPIDSVDDGALVYVNDKLYRFNGDRSAFVLENAA